MKQMVNFTITDRHKFSETYKFNIFYKKGYNLNIHIDNEYYGHGYVNLLIKFEKHINGLFFCKIYQIYSYDKKELVYECPITTLINKCRNFMHIPLMGYGDYLNCESFITDDEGNIIGKHKFNSIMLYFFYLDISFINTGKQQEVDNLFRRISQQEVYYNLHKDEIDTFRALVAAYDKQQANLRQ